jgi:hypothetical protein
MMCGVSAPKLTLSEFCVHTARVSAATPLRSMARASADIAATALPALRSEHPAVAASPAAPAPSFVGRDVAVQVGI